MDYRTAAGSTAKTALVIVTVLAVLIGICQRLLE
jgi:hypothetical protein